MSMRIFFRLALLSTLCLPLINCATITGLFTGPFTGAYSLGRETWDLTQSQEETTSKAVGWTALYGFYGLVLGAPCATYKGFYADQGYFEKGDYQGSANHPPFYEVFYPFNFNHTR